MQELIIRRLSFALGAALNLAQIDPDKIEESVQSILNGTDADPNEIMDYVAFGHLSQNSIQNVEV